MRWTTKMLMFMQLAVVTGWIFEAALAQLQTTPYECGYTDEPSAYNADGTVASCTWCSYLNAGLDDAYINSCIDDVWLHIDTIYHPAVDDLFYQESDGDPECGISCNSNTSPAPTGSMPPPSPLQSPPTPPQSVQPPKAPVKKKPTNTGLIVGVVVGGILACLLAVAVSWLVIKKKSKVATAISKDTNGDASGNHISKPPPPMPRPDKQQDVHVDVGDDYGNKDVKRYTYNQVVVMTNNWEHELGEGGFGVVYYGEIIRNQEKKQGPQQVALKRLSATSRQGMNEFLNEVRLLSRIHHRNLISLVGFCDDADNQILIYEYAEEGTLADLLYGSNGGVNFNWLWRLRIALDAAIGLEYLHNGAKPNIIHRDVKSNNILITKDWEGRVADFGLSRTNSSTQTKSHISTVVKGTPGYLDPEYFESAQLTPKSDVYSFGVVLLELVTGRRPIDASIEDPKLRSLPKFVQFYYPNNVTSVMDPQLNGDYHIGSLQKIIQIALDCLSPSSLKRPNMSDVVIEIRAALKLVDVEDQTSNKPALKTPSILSQSNLNVYGFSTSSGLIDSGVLWTNQSSTSQSTTSTGPPINYPTTTNPR